MSEKPCRQHRWPCSRRLRRVHAFLVGCHGPRLPKVRRLWLPSELPPPRGRADHHRLWHHPFLEFHRQAPPRRRSSPSSSSSPPPPPSAQQMLLALRSAVHEDQGPPAPRVAKGENPNGRKRVRTKFSQEQKEKMLSFSEKLGWKMMKSDEELVEEFCNEIGVGKGVLKVWMHNNKNTFARRDTNKITSAADLNLNATSSGNGGMLNFDNGHSENNAIHLHIPADASSPSA